MIKRSTRIFIEAMVGVLAGMALLLGIVVWRLSQEPLHVDFLTPYLEEAFAGEDSGLDIEIDETVLIWADWSRTLDLRTRGVTIRDAQDFTIAQLPDVSVNLSLRALIRGVIAPTLIEIIGARVTLVRWSDGRFDFGAQNAGTEAADSPEEADLSLLVPRILNELTSDSGTADPLSYLKAVRILGGSLTIIDRKLMKVWRAPSNWIEVRRTKSGLSGDMVLSLNTGEQASDLELAFRHDKADGITRIVARFTDFRLEALGAVDARLAPLAGVEVPLNGSATAVLGAGGRFRSVEFDLTGSTGLLSVPELLSTQLPVEGLELRGRMDGVARRLEIETARLRFGPRPGPGPAQGPTIDLSGSAILHDGNLLADVEAKALDITVNELGLYWPAKLATSARSWVTGNIRDGTVEEATLEISLRVPVSDFASTELTSISGGYRFRDLAVHYRRPMPPVTGVSGHATYDREKMIFYPEGGASGDLTISEADIVIDNFDEKIQDIDIKILVTGPLRSALELLDHESLRLTSKLGIDPAETAGTGATQARFRFPLVQNLPDDQLVITAESSLERVTLRKVLLDRDARNGRFALSLDMAGMDVHGPVELGGLPIELEWRENFNEAEGPRSVFTVKIEQLDDADRRALGLGMTPYLYGPVSAELLAIVYADRSGILETSMDLGEARLSFPFLSWEKPPGTPGKAKLALTLVDKKIAALQTVDIRAGTLSARGRGRFDGPEGSLTWLDLDEFNVGETRLTKVTVSRDGEAVALVIGGGRFDAAPVMALRKARNKAGEASEPNTILKVSAPHLDAVTFGPGRFLENVGLELNRGPEGWEVVSFQGRVPRGLWTETGPDRRSQKAAGRVNNKNRESEVERTTPEPPAAEPEETKQTSPEERLFTLEFRSGGPSGYDLEAATSDLGGVLRALDWRDTVRGGRLTIRGHSDGPIPRYPLAGRIDIEDYTLVDAPTLANILAVASLTGLVDTLSGNGIHFDVLKSEFTLTGGVARTKLLQAYGAAIGVTAKGEVDFDRAQLKAKGTVVPAYTVNRLLGAIPGLGRLLVGGEGEGLFAFTYKMEGPLDDPEVSVNPLSVLAPGFLRGLFGGIDGAEATVYPTGPDN